MIYPHDFEQRIGFAQIRDTVSLLCSTDTGRQHVRDAAFTTDFATLARILGETAEMRDILTAEGDYPGGHYTDINTFLRRLRIENTYLEPAQLVDLQRALEQIGLLSGFFRRGNEGGDATSRLYPLLGERTATVEDFTLLHREIGRLIDPESGLVRDHASPELARLRQAQYEKASQADKRLQAILRQAQAAGWVEAGSEVSVRDGRTVIPVAAVNKRKIKGLVHDESATGRTAYIEPIEVVELNNELRELANEERREIVRILTAFADRLRPELPALLRAGDLLTDLDFIEAKARYAVQTDSGLPELRNEATIHLHQARHPLLEAALKREQKAIVPLDLTLTAEKYILLISGPNAGGKSVCLKTAGLLQYMLQCGWLVPAESDSRMGIFDSLFIDIGDQQSLDNDLSTYSSHLVNMKTVLRSADERSLVLIDEFGSGTEPGTGGAIAEAVLQRLEERHVRGIITTHYANLKYYAAGAAGIANGAMAFDLQNIRPLFRLEMGRPGSSFAFEIARKVGLPEEIVQAAREKIGAAQANAEKHIREAARDKRYWESKRERIRQAEKNIDRTAAQYELQLSEIQTEKAKILHEARAEAERLLGEANRRIERTIREIRESQAERERTREVRGEFDAFRTLIAGSETAALPTSEADDPIAKKMKQLREREQRRRERKAQRAAAEETDESTAPEKPAKPKEIEVGFHVRIKGQQAAGEVLALQGSGKATVAFGHVTTVVDKSRLEIVSHAEYKKLQRKSGSSFPMASTAAESYDTSKKRLNFKQQLDIRGMRAAEALQSVEAFVDEAIMLGFPQVTILHGKGTGALKEEVRRYLRTVPLVVSATDEHEEFGGAGITVVRLDVG
ncbi:Smr/MutS family protein [uncultured Rikenella sp.]|uniref:endonuclease MutS2 n=1 Tax=uncultured Rikenella sp. TaxID=368003 RepID=UPI0025D58B92|nr:Smr/MutS family protein [uncultured Rikenella sp.]